SVVALARDAGRLAVVTSSLTETTHWQYELPGYVLRGRNNTTRQAASGPLGHERPICVAIATHPGGDTTELYFDVAAPTGGHTLYLQRKTTMHYYARIPTIPGRAWRLEHSDTWVTCTLGGEEDTMV